MQSLEDRLSEADNAIIDAVSILKEIKWKSAHKDNMEFTASITCYQKDKINKFIRENDAT